MNLQKYHNLLKEAADTIDQARYRTAEIRVLAMQEHANDDEIRVRDKMAASLTEMAAKNTQHELRSLIKKIQMLNEED